MLFVGTVWYLDKKKKKKRRATGVRQTLIEHGMALAHHMASHWTNKNRQVLVVCLNGGKTKSPIIFQKGNDEYMNVLRQMGEPNPETALWDRYPKENDVADHTPPKGPEVMFVGASIASTKGTTTIDARERSLMASLLAALVKIAQASVGVEDSKLPLVVLNSPLNGRVSREASDRDAKGSQDGADKVDPDAWKTPVGVDITFRKLNALAVVPIMPSSEKKV